MIGTSRYVVGALTLSLAFAAASCTRSNETAQDRSMRGEPGGTVDDAALNAKVKTAFVANPDVSALGIDVDSDNGVVTLTGVVSSQSEKASAERIARETSGVREVRNNLTVEERAAQGNRDLSTGISDAALTASVKMKLATTKGVPATAIDVDTQNGVVTLNGTVKDATEASAAEQVARDVSGVKDVVNNLRLSTS